MAAAAKDAKADTKAAAPAAGAGAGAKDASDLKTASGDVDPLKLLQEDCRDDDYEQVITSINRLATVATALGPARTRSELIPFLMEFTDQDNDEAQTAIGRQLGDFTDLVGGPPHAVILLPILEKLAAEEELVVRDTAVQSLAKLTPLLPKAEVAAKIVPAIRRLANGDWFTTRVSACGLFAAAYPHVTDQLQTELRSMFCNLCNDDTPMVRKAAYVNLGSFASLIQKNFFRSDIYPILKLLAADDMDSMRFYTIDCCADLGKKLEPAEYIQLLLPLLEGLQDDQSWRVRQQLAKQMAKLCEGVDADVASKRVLPIYAKLLRDKEAEVRAAACKSLPGVCAAVKNANALQDQISPPFDALATDAVQNVRVAFSASLVDVCPFFPKEAAAKLLIPLIQQLTKDEFHTVRNNIISRIDVLADSIGAVGVTNGILPNLLELAKDPKWRVRKTVVDKMGMLSKCLGVKVFEKKLQPVVIASLSDHVYAIRERACVQIGLIVDEFGGRWAAEKFFTPAFAIYDKTTNYLHRMTCLQIIMNCAAKCPADVIDKSLLPLVIMSATDDVANVRIACAKTMAIVIPKLEKKDVESKLKPLLQKLVKDTDGDVVFFGTLALKLC